MSLLNITSEKINEIAKHFNEVKSTLDGAQETVKKLYEELIFTQGQHRALTELETKLKENDKDKKDITKE